MSMLLALVSTSFACEGVYTSDLLFEDLTAINEGMKVEGGGEMEKAGARMEAGLACMAEPLTPSLYASVYRSLGVYRFNNGAADKAALWFRSAREIEPTFQFDVESMDLGSALYKTYEAARQYEGAEVVVMDGVRLVVPAGSSIYVDGKLVEEPGSTMDRYHVVQQVGSDGMVRASWLIEGNAFPTRLVEEATLTSNEAKEESEKEKEKEKESRRKKDAEVLAGGYTTDEVTTIQRERPPLKTPLIVVGAAGLAAGAGIYAASFSTRGQFDDATTVAELDAAQTLTNTLVLASGGVAVLGLGVGGFGMILDGGAGVGIQGRF
ncbi:MAG: hypothetical protein GY913_25405 [Proteobacteria bacterium]|nr:hypothetical protein [Pseudomonadota bacterium]MCP4920251.1 hypothetical protein [Pseudomonadota bacterium]